MSIELRYIFTTEDAVNAGRAARRSSWNFFIFILQLALLFGVGIFLVENDFTLAGWLWLAASVGIGIAAYEAPKFRFRRSMRQNPSLQGEIVLTISDDGIRATFPTGTSELHWRAYIKYKEAAHSFLLFRSPIQLMLIPKRVMSTEQIAEMRRLLEAKIPGESATRSGS